MKKHIALALTLLLSASYIPLKAGAPRSSWDVFETSIKALAGAYFVVHGTKNFVRIARPVDGDAGSAPWGIFDSSLGLALMYSAYADLAYDDATKQKNEVKVCQDSNKDDVLKTNLE